MSITFVFFQLKEFEGKETAQLVDRYKFLDLFPCTGTELKSIGYSPVSKSFGKPQFYINNAIP